MNPLIISQVPSLRQPVLIMAFAGWNDASESATSAVKFLLKRLRAQKFASLDPEEFYNFVEVRPQVRLADGVRREIVWPANEFSYSLQPTLAQDLILGVGIEPHFRWRTYSDTILSLARDYKVSLIVTLGALLADVVYSQPVRVTGSAVDPELAAKLKLSVSRYLGPTGIVRVLHDAFRREQLPAISLWANVPHYIAAAPNPKATLALAKRVMTLLNFTIDTSELEASSREFDIKIAELVAKDPNISSYIRQLEERDAEEREEAAEGQSSREEEAPSGDDLAEEFQKFLRRHREGRKESDE
ncbi:MAG: PAC2 family protein [Candidatus Tectomicrobia bacterium]|nr:PAC2 family protein [Candidatus Tectomicrobia bacterium]